MKKHLTTEERFYLDEKKLAEQIGDLRYDSLERFLLALSAKIASDALKDKARNRPKIADHLFTMAARIAEAAEATKGAWRIAEPFEQLEK